MVTDKLVRTTMLYEFEPFGKLPELKKRVPIGVRKRLSKDELVNKYGARAKQHFRDCCSRLTLDERIAYKKEAFSLIFGKMVQAEEEALDKLYNNPTTMPADASYENFCSRYRELTITPL
ncbi:hypothetical protein OROHE_022924 [Orobanche hederae]